MDSLDPRTLALLLSRGASGLLNPRVPQGLLGIAQGDLKGLDTNKSPAHPDLGAVEIPQMHSGKMFNLLGRQWSDGRAHSLDFYIQPSMSRNGIGLNGGGLLFRKTLDPDFR